MKLTHFVRPAFALLAAVSLEAAPQAKAPARGAKAAPVAAPAKRALTHRDYDAWRSVATPTLSRDGRYFAYSYMPQEGDGELIVKDLKTGKEQRYPVTWSLATRCGPTRLALLWME